MNFRKLSSGECMRKHVWTALAALAVASLGAPAQAAAADCQLAKLAEFPIRFEKNQPLIPVSVNGQKGWFVVDTGSYQSMMFGGAASTFGLHQSPADHRTFFGVGGEQEARSTSIAEFDLAGIKVKNFAMLTIGHRGSPAGAGLLGRDLLGQFDIEFDVAHGVLRLFQSHHCGDSSLAYWTSDPGGTSLQFDEGRGYNVGVKINGKNIDAIFDSGAGTSGVTPAVAYFVGLKPKDFEEKTFQVGGIGEASEVARIASFDKVEVGTEQINHTRLQVVDLFAHATTMRTGSLVAQRMDDSVSMLLGADFLRAHRVLLAPEQHRMYFTYAGGPIFQVVGAAVAAKDEPHTAAPATAASATAAAPGAGSTPAAPH